MDNVSSRTKPLILIVDDEPAFLEIMSAKLQASGCDIATASNGEEAIVKATQLLPSLILMDIHLSSDQSGTDVALTIKQNLKTKDVKIAFLTSMKHPWPGIAGETHDVSRELGMDEFLEKTEDLNVLIRKIQGILMRAATPQPPKPQQILEPLPPKP